MGSPQKKQAREEKQTRTELILEAATECGEFSITALAEDLIAQGLYEDPFTQRRMLRDGVKQEVGSILRGERMNNGARAWYALEDGPGARWKSWSSMTRREARQAFTMLVKKHNQAGLEIVVLRKAHKARFNEDPMVWAKEEEAKAKAKSSK